MKSVMAHPTAFLKISALMLLMGAVVFFSGPSAFAQSLIINDCQGFTRAARQAEPGEPSNVEVQVSSASDSQVSGASIKLTNTISGEVYETQSAHGFAAFHGVAPGIYTISTAQQGLQVGTIWIGAGSASALVATGAGVGAALVAGGGALGVAAAVNNLTGGNGDGDTPTPAPGPPPLPETTPTPRPTPKPTVCPVCNPEAEPTPIDNFFDSQPASQEAKAPQPQLLSPYN